MGWGSCFFFFFSVSIFVLFDLLDGSRTSTVVMERWKDKILVMNDDIYLWSMYSIHDKSFQIQ